MSEDVKERSEEKQHTPGPWGVKDYGTGAFGITSPPSNGARVYLAHVTDGGGAEANAHVMAAAPDLLAAR